jgi:hypothetical protein
MTGEPPRPLTLPDAGEELESRAVWAVVRNPSTSRISWIPVTDCAAQHVPAISLQLPRISGMLRPTSVAHLGPTFVRIPAGGRVCDSSLRHQFHSPTSTVIC